MDTTYKEKLSACILLMLASRVTYILLFSTTGVAHVLLQLTVRVHRLQAVMGSVSPHAGTPETLLRFAPTLKESLACRCAAAAGGAGAGAGHSACVAAGWGPQECAGGNGVYQSGISMDPPAICHWSLVPYLHQMVIVEDTLKDAR